LAGSVTGSIGNAVGKPCIARSIMARMYQSGGGSMALMLIQIPHAADYQIP
jgi:hypothetical protein